MGEPPTDDMIWEDRRAHLLKHLTSGPSIIRLAQLVHSYLPSTLNKHIATEISFPLSNSTFLPKFTFQETEIQTYTNTKGKPEKLSKTKVLCILAFSRLSYIYNYCQNILTCFATENSLKSLCMGYLYPIKVLCNHFKSHYTSHQILAESQ